MSVAKQQFVLIGGNILNKLIGLIWVVRFSDRKEIRNCKKELSNLLRQEKLIGATLLIFCIY